MISRRVAVRAGVTLNAMAEMYRSMSMSGLMSKDKEKEVCDAVRLANEVIYQYNALPNEVREHYFREVGSDGVSMQDMAQE